MARAKKTKRRADDPLEAYRRIRKPMPPPQKVEKDRRPELEDQHARRDIEEER
jgi:hypothetical protein